MREIALMSPSKETDNRLRWWADVEGVAFKLYVPRWRVPVPWPVRLEVIVDERLSRSRRNFLSWRFSPLE
jgi:hypothetical protein